MNPTEDEIPDILEQNKELKAEVAELKRRLLGDNELMSRSSLDSDTEMECSRNC